MTDWPKVQKDDDGIRPAGKPDECFYCQQKVGDEHKKDCVVVTRVVAMEFRIRIPVEVPHFWTTDDIDFHYNDSSWCAHNLVGLIEKSIDGVDPNTCVLCDATSATYIREIDQRPRARRKENV